MIYQAPAFMKPGIKIYGWTIGLVYVPSEAREFIGRNVPVEAVISEYVKRYRRANKVAIAQDAAGYIANFAYDPDPDSAEHVPIEDFLDDALKGKIAEMNKEYEVMNAKAFVNDAFKALGNKFTIVVAKPHQWLVYCPKRKLLTRLCWVRKLKPPIELHQYGIASICLKVEDLELENLNKMNQLLRSVGRKMELLTNYWDNLLTSVESAAVFSELEVAAEAEGERGGEEAPVEL